MLEERRRRVEGSVVGAVRAKYSVEWIASWQGRIVAGGTGEEEQEERVRGRRSNDEADIEIQAVSQMSTGALGQHTAVIST